MSLTTHEGAARRDIRLHPSAAQQEPLASAIAASIFGFDLTRPEQYPISWWLVLLITMVIAKVVQSIAASLAGTLSYLAIPVVWIFASRTIFGWSENRRKQGLLRQLPDVLAMIVRSVRVGIPVMEAIRAVARETPEPTGPEFARLVDQLSIGVPMDEAILEMSRRCGSLNTGSSRPRSRCKIRPAAHSARPWKTSPT